MDASRPLASRRDLLRLGLAAAAVLATPAALLARQAPSQGAAPVSPTEDLMREHGVLGRLLLIYEHQSAHLAAGQQVDPQALSGASRLVRAFIEDYHERLEEDYVFPRFEKAGELVRLTALLRSQHQAGRRLTSTIQGALEAGEPEAGTRPQLAEALRLFSRMYRPHKAREDTVLFPALRRVLTPKEWAEMGEVFEEKEERLFGPGGFERVVGEVASLERRLGIHDLSQFTPPGPPSSR